jgi:outer membrane murein-binding lipoprotein Lpp
VGFLDKAKQAAEQAAAKAKEGVEEVQTKRELSQAYGDLGKSVFELVEAGEISDPRLDADVEKIRTLNAKLAEEGGAATAEPEPVDAGPPAMPT